ncbi:transcriptional regulator FtrA [Xanthomonas campestris pv. badrii]|uniref:Transcriptional regulator FtrA n=1 Tax=Xanthomonas campestris pv. badrii TaxID=149696 RepID=A0A7Z2VCV1_XANCA|nr:transcriptional regulator FtrA [Xanthomonas campestris]QJD69296.1 transcriptional regulator FtrA [Xanthomonas campestris pv. badrii]
MPTSRRRARRDGLPPLVVVVAYDQLGLFEFGITTEIFGLPRPEVGPGWYRFAIAAAEPGPLRALGGLRLEVDGGLDLLDAAHTIIVPSWRDTSTPAPGALIKALQRAHKRKTRIVSICAGAFVLAQAGLLHGRRATTHWRNAEMLANHYPQITVEPGVLYVDEGDILTSAGSAAGIDLCLHIVRADFGPAVANQVAKRLVMPVHRDGGQAQFIDRPVPPIHESARLGPLLDRIAQDLTANHSVDALADAAGMSRRTFLRRFQATTGMSPGKWIVNERLNRAREMLETSGADIEQIATRCGFGSTETLRHHFRRALALSPTQYRRVFAGHRGAGEAP